MTATYNQHDRCTDCAAHIADPHAPECPSELDRTITVYTAGERCMACKLTRADLDKRGIDYTAVDLTTDEDARAYVAGLGHHSAPVVVVTDDDTMRDWSGYRPDAIAALAAADFT